MSDSPSKQYLAPTIAAPPGGLANSDPSWADRQVWTNLNSREILPDVITPLFWSMITGLQPMFGLIFKWLGLQLGGHPLIGLVAGRLYFNLNTFLALLRHLPGMGEVEIHQMLGSQAGPVEISRHDLPDMKISRLRMLIRVPYLLYQLLRHSPGNAGRFLNRLKKRGERRSQLDFKRLRDEELLREIQGIIDDMIRGAHGLAYAIQAMFYYPQLGKLCRWWLADREGYITSRLLAGQGGMASAEAALALWNLAQHAASSEDVNQIIRQRASFSQTEAQLQASPAGQDFLHRWQEFQREHGHHGRGELDLFIPRWSETPDYLLGLVRGYLDHIHDFDALANHQARGRERQKLEAECRLRLRNPLKRWIFGFCLKQAQRGSLFRENIENAAIRSWIAPGRQILQELGQRLVARGILTETRDIFFFGLDEIPALIEKSCPSEVAERLQRRQSEYHYHQTLKPPSVVIGRFEPQPESSPNHPENFQVLTGLAVSPGIVRGPARVILPQSQPEQVNPGEILVASFTDPGWTPYFLPAAAIIMDQGGLLSHGSIIAREYGIPAVVNISLATHLIQTGQWIEVDGNNGQVRLLANPTPTPPPHFA